VKEARRGLLILGVPVALGLGLFAFDFPRVVDDDMAPTLRRGDLVAACRLCGGLGRGDLVLFADPEQKGRLSIRRVVGLPGDQVELRRGRLLLNGAPLVDESEGVHPLPGVDPGLPPASFELSTETLGAHRFRVARDAAVELSGTLPAETLGDAYFLVADRRTLAHDSRVYGPVPRRQIRSIVMRIVVAGDGDGSRQTRIP
jgi:signal peptidase I